MTTPVLTSVTYEEVMELLEKSRERRFARDRERLEDDAFLAVLIAYGRDKYDLEITKMAALAGISRSTAQRILANHPIKETA